VNSGIEFHRLASQNRDVSWHTDSLHSTRSGDRPFVYICEDEEIWRAVSTSACGRGASGLGPNHNHLIYGPAESYSLWTELGTAGQSWQIFNAYSWVGGFSVVDTYHCDSESYQRGAPDGNAPAGSTTQITASCSGVDSKGLAFTMNYVVYTYSYYSRGGGGKGGGGAGTRWQITGGSVSVNQ
jgi:hypothetical protein